MSLNVAARLGHPLALGPLRRFGRFFFRLALGLALGLVRLGDVDREVLKLDPVADGHAGYLGLLAEGLAHGRDDHGRDKGG